jgi:hypothetical protein
MSQINDSLANLSYLTTDDEDDLLATGSGSGSASFAKLVVFICVLIFFVISSW